MTGRDGDEEKYEGVTLLVARLTDTDGSKALLMTTGNYDDWYWRPYSANEELGNARRLTVAMTVVTNSVKLFRNDVLT